jgi:hypothetical protein
MSRIVFAHPRNVYSSYTDFRMLVELSGFQSCLQDEVDLETDAVYILSPINREFGEWALRRLPAGHRRARMIWWNLERPDVDTVPVLDLPKNAVHASVDSVASIFDAIWVSDRYLASLNKMFTYVVMGSDVRLANGPRMETKYDLCHMAYIWGRREILNRLGGGWRVAPACWGVERDVVLRSSFAMINIHQTPAPAGEPLRIALSAAYRLPLITETLADPTPFHPDVHMVMMDYSRAEETLTRWLTTLEGRQGLSSRGEALHQALCIDRTFGGCVRRGVEEMTSRS